MDLKTYAQSRGRTLREFLQMCHLSVRRSKISDANLRVDLYLLERDPNDHPSYVIAWMRKRKVNGHEHRVVCGGERPDSR